MNLTNEQKYVVRKLLEYRENSQVQTLGGYAGTGKTTVVRALAEALPGYAACAFTGKAAHVMRTKGMEASTIHSLIYTPKPTNGGGVVFVLKQRYEVGCSGFLVDEASMVSRELHADLLSFGLPVIFVGDHGQLPPVGSDVHVMAEPMYRLETIHRNAGGIAYFAEHIRQGKPPRRFSNEKRVRFVDPREVTDRLLLRAGQMICAFNKTRTGVNDRIRELLGHTGVVQRKDRIICLRNNRQAGLFNGMQGTVVRIRPKRRLLDFIADDGTRYSDVFYDLEQFGKETPEFGYGPDSPNPFDYAYCVTAHKAQGSEWRRVLVFEQPCRHWDHWRWAYTAASRAKARLYWVAAPRILVPVPERTEPKAARKTS